MRNFQLSVPTLDIWLVEIVWRQLSRIQQLIEGRYDPFRITRNTSRNSNPTVKTGDQTGLVLDEDVVVCFQLSDELVASIAKIEKNPGGFRVYAAHGSFSHPVPQHVACFALNQMNSLYQFRHPNEPRHEPGSMRANRVGQHIPADIRQHIGRPDHP